MHSAAGPAAAQRVSTPRLRIVGSSSEPMTAIWVRFHLPTIAGVGVHVEPPSALVQETTVELLPPSGLSETVGYRWLNTTSWPPTRTIFGGPPLLYCGPSPVP